MNIPKLKFPFPTYIVGGWVRDKIMNPDSNPKDLDLCMVVDSFKKMEKAIIDAGGEIFLSTPKYKTIRCKIPELGAVDFAMARKDGKYSDGRRPDSTDVADNIVDDLQRRDFRINAIAIDISNGEIIDPFGGTLDIEARTIDAVGDPRVRFEEDALRMIRAIRFAVTKGFDISFRTSECLKDSYFINKLFNISEERIREELHKCFHYDTLATLSFLQEYRDISKYIFDETNIWLKPTNES